MGFNSFETMYRKNGRCCGLLCFFSLVFHVSDFLHHCLYSSECSLLIKLIESHMNNILLMGLGLCLIFNCQVNRASDFECYEKVYLCTCCRFCRFTDST